MRHLLFLVLLLATLSVKAQKNIKTRMVVIGIDGLNTIDLPKANTPNIDYLMSIGAWTMNCKTVMPSSSSPNWAAMIMGATPDLTTVHANGWHREDGYVPNPTCDSFPDFFPTIFYELHRQHPKSKIALIHQWPGFRFLVVDKNFSKRRFAFISAQYTMRKAKRYEKLKEPELLFIHLDLVDHAGHKYGHGSPEYIAAVEKADKLIGQMITRMKKHGLWDDSYVLVTSDHGGIGHGHGGDSPAETNVPWILVGPKVKQGEHITSLVNTYDTALTIAKILGVTPNACWVGKPVDAAFR